MIKDYHIRNILRELARCLALFPNMHTLKLDHTITTVGLVDKAMTYGFGRHMSFPQIRSIMLPGNCSALLKCVPGARHVYFRESQSMIGPWLPNFAADFPLLKNILFVIPSKLTGLRIFCFLHIRC